MSDASVKRVGLIGLGKMGGPMVRHIIAGGFAVTGYDVKPALIETAAADGAIAAATPAEVAANADVVLIAVGFDAEVEMALFRNDGIMEGIGEGAIIAICSTVAPGTVARIARRIGEAPVRLIDCPLTRGEQAAIDGKMLTMVGGDEADFEAWAPTLGDLGPKILRVGDVGTASIAENAMIQIMMFHVVTFAYGLAVFDRANLPQDVLMEATGGEGLPFAEAEGVQVGILEHEA